MSIIELSDDALLDAWRELEAERRRSAVREYEIIAEVESRGLAFARGCKSTADFARNLLRITPAEAKARLCDTERLTSHVAPSGASCGPTYPALAAAQAAGDISPAHSRIVYTTIEKLSNDVTFERDTEIEEFLVEQARVFDPSLLGRVAERLRATLDQDGTLADLDRQERRRGLEFRRRPDGSAHIEGELTAECAEHLETQLDALAKPAPVDDGTRDPRTPAQRRHDALLEMLKLVERARLLPKAAGVTATILLHMDVDAFTTGDGVATTGHGYAVPAEVAKRWAGAEARIMLVLLSKTRRVEAYSTVQRLFTEQQRLAMMARDLGCSFPVCDSTPLWTEAHHVTEYQLGGETSTDNGALVCGRHHAEFEQMGWQSVMIDGAPWWIPPGWLDPLQRAIRNTMHERAIG
jgi:hypothetical protein